MSCRLPEALTEICGRGVAVHRLMSGLVAGALPIPYSHCLALYDQIKWPGDHSPATRPFGQLAELVVVTVMGVLPSTRLLAPPGVTPITVSVSLPLELILSALTPLLISFCR